MKRDRNIEHVPTDNRIGKAADQRSWTGAVGWAALFVAAGVILSAAVNPLFGRSVHWDWMAGLAPALLLGLALSLRRRWI
jgi:hypothetical protein